ncbi:MAG: hypothetical protein QM516_14010 [Limnohabitans sp.]|nr:hypothetical protein [Limnohabitans sp.]
MTRCLFVPISTAILAVGTSAWAEVPRRVLDAGVKSTIELRSGRSVGCTVEAWSGESFEGSCGTYRWEDVEPAAALRLLRAVIPAKDAQAAADATAILLSLVESGDSSRSIAGSAVDLAKRAGASKEQIEKARAEATQLVAARKSVDRAAKDAALESRSPEGHPFASTPWPTLDANAFERASATGLESARSLLAAAGTSSTMHEQTGIVVLAEQSADVHKEDAVELEGMFRTWAERFSQAGHNFSPQGRIPVVIAGSTESWRLMLATAASAHATNHAEVLVVYRAPKDNPAGPLQAIVLVAPEGDHTLRRSSAAFGLARAMLHYATTAERSPGWLNEGLPRVMADVSFPKARVDITIRQRGLDVLRGGDSFAQIISAKPGSGIWQGGGDKNRAEVAKSLCYLFARYLYEKNAIALVRVAKPPVPKPTVPNTGNATPEPFESRFRKAFGMTVEAAASQAQRWYQTND